MIGDPFFYIPIYVRTIEAQEKRCKQIAKREIERAKQFPGSVYERALNEYSNYHEPLTTNDIIGWLCLWVENLGEGPKILAEEWWDDHPRRKVRAYDCLGHSAICVAVEAHDTSNDIYQKVLLDINEFAQDPSIGKRFVDTQQLELIGSYINWRALVDNLG